MKIQSIAARTPVLYYGVNSGKKPNCWRNIPLKGGDTHDIQACNAFPLMVHIGRRIVFVRPPGILDLVLEPFFIVTTDFFDRQALGAVLFVRKQKQRDIQYLRIRQDTVFMALPVH